MYQKQWLKVALVLLFQIKLYAQAPQKPDAVAIYHQIEKLNFVGSVLYIAAHPDDENTRLISYMANSQKARTGYLSLTRGDGGQNLIGPELREQLGVIRTQELIEARKIDGGEQFFTRANDFGFSKVPDETLQIWNKNQVLEDMIYIIRKFQPDVIVNRFDHRTPGTTHGHHTSSAMLALEAFDKTNDAAVYPKQLQFTQLWQPKRIYFNHSWWSYGGKDKFDKADKSRLTAMELGVYYPMLGKSNQEIAALSRSRHQSQGFGTTGTRGEEIEYLELIKGNAPKIKNQLFEGIDTTWNRIPGGAPIGKMLEQVLKDFDFKNPAAITPKLVATYAAIQKLPDSHWKPIKLEELKNIIAACTGLYLEAIAETSTATLNSNVLVRLEAINRSAIPMQWISINVTPKATASTFDKTALRYNISEDKEITITIPDNFAYTTPYWLEKEGTVGMYRIDEQEHIGIPDIIRQAKVEFTIAIDGVEIPFQRYIVYKYNDEVKGEVYHPFDIVPDVTTSIISKVTIFNSNKPQPIQVKVKAGKDAVSGTVQLNLPKDWKVTPVTVPFNLAHKNSETTVTFQVTPPKETSEVEARSVAVVQDKILDKEQQLIQYDHIAYQQILAPAKAKFIKLDIQIRQEKIAYIMGAGDEVPDYLKQMGYDVTLLKPQDITPTYLNTFQTIILGIRAYNTVKELAFKQNILLNAVKEGKTMIVQYNTTGKMITPDFSPYPLKISRDRVTEENAEVRFLAPNHKVLHYPNTITAADFKGWVQEQGLYYPNEWDVNFTPILSSNDKDESPKNGALLIAPYGKGYYIYTGLSFFRELPAGVSGAYRLFANLISLQQ